MQVISRFADATKVAPLAVRIWLITGLLMIFLQIVIGGVTRLTGSGLSITRWEIVTGAVPPLSQADWQAEFDLYRQTPQYQKINRGMTLDEFKFIYFWEYFHRLWARLMFFVFVFPFAWFLWRRMLARPLVSRLVVVVLLAGLEGFFGWIMVYSGLRDRPWVNAYNLTLHLCMGFLIFGYLLWATFMAFQPVPAPVPDARLRRFAWVLVAVASVQIALGAMVSGAKAALFFPTWPDMNGAYLPGILLDGSHWTLDSFVQYDTNPFMPALLQFLHRNTGYVLALLTIYFFWRVWRQQVAVSRRLLRGVGVLLAMVAVQVLLGVLTLINSRAGIPVDLGVLHQAGAVVLMGILLFVVYQLSGRRQI